VRARHGAAHGSRAEPEGVAARAKGRDAVKGTGLRKARVDRGGVAVAVGLAAAARTPMQFVSRTAALCANVTFVKVTPVTGTEALPTSETTVGRLSATN